MKIATFRYTGSVRPPGCAVEDQRSCFAGRIAEDRQRVWECWHNHTTPELAQACAARMLEVQTLLAAQVPACPTCEVSDGQA